MSDKINKIREIKDAFKKALSSIVKNRNNKIESVIKKEDEQKIQNILNNLK